MSLLSPEIPRSPECLLSSALSSAAPSSSLDITCSRIAGSRSPLRLPITRPSSGVKPIEVSTVRPPRMAAIEQPLPRWQVTTRSSGSPVRPRISAERWDTKRCEVPWNP